MEHLWRPASGLPEYEVSSLGGLRRVGSVLTLRPRVATNGYARVNVYSGKRHRTILLHKVVAETFLGPAPTGMEVNHIDGDKANPALSNLEYATKKDNMQHASRMGLRHFARGSRHGMAKLTETDAIAIRNSTGPHRVIAARFGISRQQVDDIIAGRRWRHLLAP